MAIKRYRPALGPLGHGCKIQALMEECEDGKWMLVSEHKKVLDAGNELYRDFCSALKDLCFDPETDSRCIAWKKATK